MFPVMKEHVTQYNSVAYLNDFNNFWTKFEHFGP